MLPDRRTENRSTGRQGDRVPLLKNFVCSQPDKGPGGRGCGRVTGYNFTDSLQISSHWTEFCFIAIKH